MENTTNQSTVPDTTEMKTPTSGTCDSSQNFAKFMAELNEKVDVVTDTAPTKKSTSFTQAIEDRVSHPEDEYEFQVECNKVIIKCKVVSFRKFNWIGYVAWPVNHPDRDCSVKKLNTYYSVHNGITYNKNGSCGFMTAFETDYVLLRDNKCLTASKLPFRNFDYVKAATIDLARQMADRVNMIPNELSREEKKQARAEKKQARAEKKKAKVDKKEASLNEDSLFKMFQKLGVRAVPMNEQNDSEESDPECEIEEDMTNYADIFKYMLQMRSKIEKEQVMRRREQAMQQAMQQARHRAQHANVVPIELHAFMNKIFEVPVRKQQVYMCEECHEVHMC